LSRSSPLAPGESVVAGFLREAPEAIATVTSWAREVAEHRAWGFDAPDDIVQATLLAVLRNLREGRFTEGDPKAYVRRIAKNLCVTSYRRRRVRGTEIPLDDGSGDGAATNGVTARGPGTDAEAETLLREVLDRMDARCRELIDRAYAQGMSRREIAADLGVSEGAVRVRLFRCLEQARRSVRDEEETT